MRDYPLDLVLSIVPEGLNHTSTTNDWNVQKYSSSRYTTEDQRHPILGIGQKTTVEAGKPSNYPIDPKYLVLGFLE